VKSFGRSFGRIGNPGILEERVASSVGERWMESVIGDWNSATGVMSLPPVSLDGNIAGVHIGVVNVVFSPG
jgi:hypothetical protein